MNPQVPVMAARQGVQMRQLRQLHQVQAGRADYEERSTSLTGSRVADTEIIVVVVCTDLARCPRDPDRA
jgi:hypothetical protein